VAIPAILLLIFNRSKHLGAVMNALREHRPPKLYVAADGPRDLPGEAERCEEARRVATLVDWPCEVQTLFREKNLGCKAGVSTAIDWFFSHEEEGIILEDDCVPSQSFFTYCAELLDRYRNDTRIMCVSGNNFQQGRQVTEDSYYFSSYVHCWGWATWRRAWNLYDADMSLWPDFKASGLMRAFSHTNSKFELEWTKTFDATFDGRVNTWDYQFLFACWANNALTCLPSKNLVSNIGFDEFATHTQDTFSSSANIVAYDLDFPLKHPQFIAPNWAADRFEDEVCYGVASKPRSSIFKKIIKNYIVRA
jgi:hypothetical protein